LSSSLRYITLKTIYGDPGTFITKTFKVRYGAIALQKNADVQLSKLNELSVFSEILSETRQTECLQVDCWTPFTLEINFKIYAN